MNRGTLESLLLLNFYERNDYTNWENRYVPDLKVDKIEIKKKFSKMTLWERVSLAWEGFKTDDASPYKYIANGMRGALNFILYVVTCVLC